MNRSEGKEDFDLKLEKLKNAIEQNKANKEAQDKIWRT
jgi:hypothetical protein